MTRRYLPHVTAFFAGWAACYVVFVVWAVVDHLQRTTPQPEENLDAFEIAHKRLLAQGG